MILLILNLYIMKTLFSKFFYTKHAALGVLGAIGSLGTNLVSNYFQGKMDNENKRKMIDYQANKFLDMQSQLNMRQYPEMAASMRMAGLNPAMITSPAGSQVASMPSDTSHQQAPHMSIGEISQLELLDSQRKLNEAQANQLNASANNINEDTQTKIINNDTLYYQILTHMEYEKSGSMVNAETAAKLRQEVTNLGQEFENLQQIYKNLQSEGRSIEETIKYIGPEAKARIANYLSQSKYMSDENARREAEYVWNVEESAAKTFMYGMQGRAVNVETKINEIILRLKKKYGDTSEAVQIARDVFGIANDVIESSSRSKVKVTRSM